MNVYLENVHHQQILFISVIIIFTLEFGSLVRFPNSYKFENYFYLKFKNDIQIRVPRYNISCISPVIDQKLRNDQTVRSHFLDYEINSECLNNLHKIFKGETIEEKETNDILSVLVLLGHIELYERIPIDKENVVERILHKRHFQQSTENEIEYIKKHFTEVKNKEKLPFEVVYHILCNLRLEDENFILKFIENYFETTSFQESKIKHKKCKLLQCIKIENLNGLYLKKYFSHVKKLLPLDLYQITPLLETFFTQIKETNDNLITTNKELKETNNNLTTTNKELKETNNNLITTNKELKETNNSLITTNKELKESNNNLITTNKGLKEKNDNLITTNKELKEMKDNQIKENKRNQEINIYLSKVNDSTHIIGGKGTITKNLINKFKDDIHTLIFSDYIEKINVETFSENNQTRSPFSILKSLNNITLLNCVTSIGNDAFSYCSSLTNIFIPNSVTSIGNSTFSGCSSLTNINIPNSVTSIGKHAFSWCSSLTNINIPNSVTSIGDYAFRGCSSLTNINIPNSVTSIGVGAFYECSSLTNITIPNSVTSIGKEAFSCCSSLTNICIPCTPISIGEYTFSECKSLTNLYIPNSVTSISTNAFSGCSSLTNINTPKRFQNQFGNDSKFKYFE